MASNDTARNPSAPHGMTVQNFADALGKSKSTVYKWSQRGWPDFPHYIELPDNSKLILFEQYQEWLDIRRR